jgi:hypothetical protein
MHRILVNQIEKAFEQLLIFLFKTVLPTGKTVHEAQAELERDFWDLCVTPLLS